MGTTMLLALVVAIGVLMIFIGLARTPSTNTAQMVQQRLSVYGGEKPLTVEEIELQRPFSERVLRPAIERLGSLLSRSTPGKARQDLLNRLELAGRPGNLTPEDFAAGRLVAAAVMAAVGLLIGLLLGNPVYLVISLVGTFQYFTQAFTLTNGRGDPNNATLFVNLELFKEAFTFSRMGYGAAIAWLLFVIVIVLTLAIFAFARKRVYYAGADR